MDIEKYWEKALKKTEIIRSRVKVLKTQTNTRVPYIFLAESSINVGDTVVRKGEIDVHKPSLIVPPHNPQFNGFEFDDKDAIDENTLINFLIVRGITLPSLFYNNQTHSLDVFEGKLSKAIEHYNDIFKKTEDVHSGLIVGPEDCWQFSLLIFICAQIVRNMDNDIRRLLDDYKNKENN